MRMRVGKVTQIFPNTGKIQVLYEDEGNASLQLSMITMNQEYSMPTVGDRVLTMHMENGSSKGFVLGTYYGGGMQPRANSGYRKDFGGNAYVICKSGAYRLSAGSVTLLGGGAALNLKGKASLVGSEVTVGSGDSEDEDTEPDVYLKITSDTAEVKATEKISLNSDNEAEVKAAAKIDIASDTGANLTLDSESELKAPTLVIEADDLTLKCSYGEETFENILKRIERIEDQLGLPHTI